MEDCPAPGGNSPKVSNRKQAIIVCTFLIYVMYNAAVLVMYIKKNAEVSLN